MKPIFCKFCLLTLLLACFTTARYSQNQSLCQPKCITAPNRPNDSGCKIQEQKCFMKDRSRTTGGIAKPVQVHSGPGWYLYRANQYDSIALNFSWKLPKEFLTKNLEGFRIVIQSEKRFRSIKAYQPDTIYFCIDGNLTANGKNSPQFYYDCYGKFDSAPVELGDYFTIYITPNSGNLTQEQFKMYSLSIGIQVPPNCDDESLRNVKTCKRSISVSKYVCNNRTAIVRYTLPQDKATTATFKLCRSRIRSAETERCNDKVRAPNRSMPLSVTAMPIEVPDEKNWREGFFVEVHRNVQDDPRQQVRINFTDHCSSSESASPLPLGIVLPTCVVASVAFIIMVLCLLKTGIFKQCLIDQACPRKGVIAAKPKTLESRPDEKNRSPSIYIIFVDDHFKHKEIVSKFAKFLQNDLEFRVIFELWDQVKLHSNCTLWLENVMALADKILVIWSPGAKRRWELQTSIDTHQDDLYDLFTPVMIQIKKDLLRKQNVGKYFFAYFEYCSESDIPQAFHKQSFRQFKLMHQFEELYFRLKNTGNSQPGLERNQEKVAFDKIYCPKISTLDPILKNAISDMCIYVKNNPTWHCNEKSSLNTKKGNNFACYTSDKRQQTAQTKTSNAAYVSDKIVVRNFQAPDDCDSLSEDDCHSSELKPCFTSFEIGHDFETTSHLNCTTPGPEKSSMRLSEHLFIDSIRADYFTEDNFKSSSETLYLEQNISETHQVS